MHRSHGLQGSLKRRRKHPYPTFINGYHTAENDLGTIVYKTPHVCFHGRKCVHTRLRPKNRTQRPTRRNRGLPSLVRSGALRYQRNCHRKNSRRKRMHACGVCPLPPASRPRWAALLCLQFGDVAVFSLCVQYFLNVQGGRALSLPSACSACC